MAEINFEQFEELEIPMSATPETEMHHTERDPDQKAKSKSQRWLKAVVVILVVCIVAGFGIFFVYKYLFAQSKNPDSLVGAAWVDIHTKPDSDPDQDGLSNAEEARLATNFWQNDSDGDGFSDGDEVKHGYNPNGAGKLVDSKFDFNALEK